MAQTDYIVRAGVGFDIDRQSGQEAIKLMDVFVGGMQSAATKKTAEGFAQRQRDYDKVLSETAAANKKADDDLVKGTEQVAQRAAAAIGKARPKPLTSAQKDTMDASAIAKYQKDYDSMMKGMSSSYGKFAKEAEALGIKVSKTAGGWGTKAKVDEFAKADATNRKRQIDLTKRMITEAKRELDLMKERGLDVTEQEEHIKNLVMQKEDMVDIDRDKANLERKHAKETKKNDKVASDAAKAKKKADNDEMRRLKTNTRQIKEKAKAIGAYASQIGSTLKNAFVIGTAAAGAFFYKMQPVTESVMAFENELMNAQSIFQVSRKELHALSDVVVEFGLQYGIAYDTAISGLYQYASAGVSAAEANEMLAHTLKLSMAVQGDHEALAKLTTQTIMGFSMEFSQAEEVTDKFAHAINKSLIEWDDLASSVKFALPFFISTGQSIDQLLGALQVLTNRALEAGIAGRGLRQALAEFTQHAEDNAAAFNKMGVSILDMAGNMKPLNEIAQQFKDLMGDNVNDMDIMIALMEDLNIRGATAFVHLVQNAEEFTAAVADLQNAAGTATEMADIQQQSLTNQIQRVKNALLAPFLFSDKIGEANDTLNEFTNLIKDLVDEFVGFFIIEDEMGQRLTQHGEDIRTFVVDALEIAVGIIKELKQQFLETGTGIETFTRLLHLAVLPLNIILKIMKIFGPRTLEWIVYLKLAQKLMPINIIMWWRQTRAIWANTAAMQGNIVLSTEQILIQVTTAAVLASTTTFMGIQTIAAWGLSAGFLALNATGTALVWTWRGLAFAMGSVIALFSVSIMMAGGLGDAMAALAGILVVVTAMKIIYDWAGKIPVFGWAIGVAAAATMAVAAMALRNKIQKQMGMGKYAAGTGGMPSTVVGGSGAGAALELPKERLYDLGGPVTSEHRMAMLQKGETVNSKTQNMLGGGITLNIEGDIVTNDAEDFAERIAEVLPLVLRRQSDIGGI